MAFERPRPANDNFSAGELREQQKDLLLKYGAQVQTVREWIARQQSILKNARQIGRATKEEMHTALEALQDAVTTADIDIGVAENEPDNRYAFERARQSGDDLFAAFEEAARIFGNAR